MYIKTKNENMAVRELNDTTRNKNKKKKKIGESFRKR